MHTLISHMRCNLENVYIVLHTDGHGSAGCSVCILLATQTQQAGDNNADCMSCLYQCNAH